MSAFTPTLVRLQLPEGCGSVSCRGIEVTADADGCIEVPPDVAAELRCHGVVPATAPAKAGKAK